MIAVHTRDSRFLDGGSPIRRTSRPARALSASPSRSASLVASASALPNSPTTLRASSRASLSSLSTRAGSVSDARRSISARRSPRAACPQSAASGSPRSASSSSCSMRRARSSTRATSSGRVSPHLGPARSAQRGPRGRVQDRPPVGTPPKERFRQVRIAKGNSCAAAQTSPRRVHSKIDLDRGSSRKFALHFLSRDAEPTDVPHRVDRPVALKDVKVQYIVRARRGERRARFETCPASERGAGCPLRSIGTMTWVLT